jgi:hypothetical protein
VFHISEPKNVAIIKFFIFILVLPAGKEINISYADGKITIDTLTVAGKFSDLPLWEAGVDR